jgi:hypothetical protein
MALDDLNEALGTGLRVPHVFELCSYTKPTYCAMCKKLLVGLFRQGRKCTIPGCGLNVHSACVIAAQRLEEGCRGGLAQVQVHVGAGEGEGGSEEERGQTQQPAVQPSSSARTGGGEEVTLSLTPMKRMELEVEETSQADYAAMEAALGASPTSGDESVGEAASSGSESADEEGERRHRTHAAS